MNKTITAALLISSLAVYAGEGGMGSGGGKGIICFNSAQTAQAVRDNNGLVFDEYIDDIKLIEMIDLRYARLPESISSKSPEIIPFTQNDNLYTYMEKIRHKVRSRWPDLEASIRKAEKSISKNTLLRGFPLKPKNDENATVSYESKYCTVTTLAVQYREAWDIVLELDYRLFNHPAHSDQSKAVLLLHEYLYSVARDRGAKDSRHVRKVIRTLLNNEGKSLIEDTMSIYHLGFFSHSPVFEENIRRDELVEPLVFAAPIGAIYDIASAYLNTLGREVLNYKEEEREDLVERLRYLFFEIGVHDRLTSFSRAKALFDEHEEALRRLSPEQTEKLKADIQRIHQGRLETVQAKLDNLANTVPERYLSNLSYLSGKERSAIAQMAYNIGQIYVELCRDYQTKAGYSSTYGYQGSYQEKTRELPEDFARKQFFSIESLRNLEVENNANLLIKMILFQYHQVGGLDLNQMKVLVY